MKSFEARRLIVFGCGYIGGEVARQAVIRGARVTALTRNLQTAERLKEEGVETVVADLASEAWHGQIQGGSDYVLDAVSSGGGGVSGYRNSYVGGMQSLLRWTAGTQPMGTLVYTSSTSVYPQDGGALVDESASTEGGGELPRILLEAEELIREPRLMDAQGAPPRGDRGAGFVRSFILRLAGIYGPGRHHLVDQVRRGTVAGRGDHHLNLAHRDDVVRAIWAAFEAPAEVSSGVFNVADDKPTLKREIVAWLAQQLRVPEPLFSGAPAEGRRAVTPDRLIVNAKLKSVLGWNPRYPTFREGYKNMLALRSE